MLTCETLEALKDALSEGRAEGPLSLREFGEMLGGAVDRRGYGKGYVSKLLRGKTAMTSRVARAARVLMVGVAGLDERGWIDAVPSFEGRPIERVKVARESGVSWQDVYASDADVRVFVDTVVEIISRG